MRLFIWHYSLKEATKFTWKIFFKNWRLYYKGKKGSAHVFTRQTNQFIKIAFSSVFFSKNHVCVISVFTAYSNNLDYLRQTVRESCGWLPFSFQIYNPKYSCCWSDKRNSKKELKTLKSNWIWDSIVNKRMNFAIPCLKRLEWNHPILFCYPVSVKKSTYKGMVYPALSHI